MIVLVLLLLLVLSLLLSVNRDAFGNGPDESRAGLADGVCIWDCNRYDAAITFSSNISHVGRHYGASCKHICAIVMSYGHSAHYGIYGGYVVYFNKLTICSSLSNSYSYHGPSPDIISINAHPTDQISLALFGPLRDGASSYAGSLDNFLLLSVVAIVVVVIVVLLSSSLPPLLLLCTT